MPTALPDVRTLISARTIARLLAVLALAIALVAIPTFRPDGASAQRRSEQSVKRTCAQLGGTLEKEVMDPQAPSIYNLTCTQLFWDLFSCYSAGGPFGGMVACPY
jgi:hypothetical protein